MPGATPPTPARPWRAWWLAALLTAAWAAWAGWQEVAQDDPLVGHQGVELVRRVGRDLARADAELFRGFEPFDGDPPGPAGGLPPEVALRGVEVITRRAPAPAREALLLLWQRHADGDDTGAAARLSALPPPSAGSGDVSPDILERLHLLLGSRAP